MHANELLNQLEMRGVKLCATADGIRYEAPRGVFTPELRDVVAAHKAELLALLCPTDDAHRLSVADCLGLIREAFDAVDYVGNAMALLNLDRDLARRFRATEAAIDAAIKGGPTESDFRRAVMAHVAVIRECCERQCARRDAEVPEAQAK